MRSTSESSKGESSPLLDPVPSSFAPSSGRSGALYVSSAPLSRETSSAADSTNPVASKPAG
eukprot:CAMPEP_0197449952 /NCGR_PEP_ID=MMETSP1175-20131217/23474_1 /TAXON_ID=1003142 /ORGANISM="Triceratium dubium, Strain CCMP147" /LENGTH=60 /DNA_ID=CAMNT_0042982241 /DNA_START=1 /DNA_END=179 /DNA_ORIENTATION=-